jgi:glycosyltransferase involved in cell wall biosynthesis
MKASLPDRHVLIFEPGRVGHRLTWLRYVTEDFLAMGYKLTWAVDMSSRARHLIEEQLSALLPKVSVLPLFHENGRWRRGSKIRSLEECREISQAGEVFLNEFDEIASGLLRGAAVGIMPPRPLQGRLSGVYFRPRFLTEPHRPPGNILKARGFQRLCRQGWFRHLYFVDEYLFPALAKNDPAYRFHFLPDPWSGDFSCPAEIARNRLGIPPNKVVYLHYGMGDRRKGLHLAVDAMGMPAADPQMFLLCAGQISDDRNLLEKLAGLEKRGLAKLMNHYVSEEEERLCFSSADGVLLPYIHHYGSSGVLSRAAAAGKLAIVSDEGLLARRVRDHRLGLLFQTNSIRELRQRMNNVISMGQAGRDQYRKSSLNYAETCSREAFRAALTSPWCS